jgi:WD40 repeat protein
MRPPVATAVASLSIAINPPPSRNAALYLSDQTGLQIQSDGSLTLLPSSPESASAGFLFGSSSKLPLLFLLGNPPTNVLESLLINQDYSLTLYSSVPLQARSDNYAPPAIDPTGSNLYLLGPIDGNLTTGVTIYPGNGSLQLLGRIAIPNVSTHSRLVFTPDGTLAFISTCDASHVGSILSYSRSSDGMLTPATVYVIPGNFCAENGLLTSPDGKYLATGVLSGEVQVYRIASDGSLTPVLLQPFTVTLDPQGDFVSLHDMTWDQSSSFLLVATGLTDNSQGGVAVLSFTGSALTETVYPTGPAQGSIRRTGSFVYSTPLFPNLPPVPAGILGFNYQNGQLIPLPNSPYPYGQPNSDMVIY